jgi:hypothetical protein
MTLEDQANKTAQLASRASFYLHGAALATDRADKRRLLVKAFTVTAHFNRSASSLQAMAPTCAQEGYAEAAKLQDYIEGQAAG